MSLCRACLEGDVKMYSLDNYILQIYEKLTNTKLSARGPHTVCYICHSLLQRCHRFAKMAHYSENTLMVLHEQGIEISHDNILVLNSAMKCNLSQSCVCITDVSNVENTTDVTAKTECNASEADPATIKEEFIKDEPIEAVGFEVDPPAECSYSATQSLSESNVTTNHEDSNSLASRVRTEPMSHICRLCAAKFSEKEKLIAHIQTHNRRTWVCASIVSLYVGNVCDNILFSSRSLYCHTLAHQGIKPYTCNECQKSFTYKSAMRVHMHIHTKEKPYTCDICDKKFSRKSYLVKHLKVHSGVRPEKCNVCEKTFLCLSRLKTHIQIHNEDTYVCDYCDRKFLYKSSLTKHMLTHTKDKPFPCDLCDKSFAYQSSLTNHKMLHTNKWPHACAVCDRKFAQKHNLNVHMRTHTGEKPYACDICAMKFSLKSVLKNHSRTHTGERPYACDKCDMKFTRRWVLTKHNIKKNQCKNNRSKNKE